MSQLSDFIDEIAQDGQKESGGQFSVDAVRARQKLQVFRLADPTHYVLPLASAALMSGATVINFQGDFGNLTMDFDGRPFTALELEDCLAATQGRLGELGIGLSASLAVEPQRVLVSSTHGQTVTVLEIKNKRAITRSYELDWRERLPRGNRLEVIGGGRTGGVRALLRQRCPHSPELCYQGKRICIPDCYSSAGMLSVSSPGVSDPPAPVSAWVVKRRPGEEVAAKIWLTDTRNSLFHFVFRGITYTESVNTHPYPGLHGIIRSPKVKLDISRGGLVRNREFDEFVAALVAELANELFPHIGRHFRGMLPVHRKMARRYLETWLAGTDSPYKDIVRKNLDRVK